MKLVWVVLEDDKVVFASEAENVEAPR